MQWLWRDYFIILKYHMEPANKEPQLTPTLDVKVEGKDKKVDDP